MDVPNFYVYEISPCTNRTNASTLEKDCFKYVEAGDITESDMWLTWIFFKNTMTRILPLLAIIVMNTMIIWKLHQIWKKKKRVFAAGGLADTSSRTRVEAVATSVQDTVQDSAPQQVSPQ